MPSPPARAPLSVRFRILLGMGDHSLNLSLTAMSLLYVFYLTEVVGLRPALAGTVPLIGRLVDAVTDPLMGRISDLTRSRFGRRRPYLALGAIPYSVSFVLLWVDPGFESQLAMFAFYTGVYVAYAVCATVLTVPYLALLPEVAPGYDERSSLNAWRSALSMLATLVAAVGFRPLASFFGQGAAGFVTAAGVFGLWMAWPWFAIFLATREKQDSRKRAAVGFVEALRTVAAHGAYRNLVGLYLCGRIAMDLTGMILVYYFEYWMRRPRDFEILFLFFLVIAVASLPVWVALARRTDKAHVFVAGACWWALAQLVLLPASPEWPRFLPMTIAVLAAVGYGIVDMMPWSMLADVVDEDELLTGERREGVYSGVFGFVRKLGGAVAVWIAGLLLDLSGFTQGAGQPGAVLWTIRILTVVVPPVFLLLAVVFALRYGLTRERHQVIVATLEKHR